MSVFSVRHVTEYRYRRPVGFGEHRIMFRPRDSFDQRLIDAQLLVTPEPVSTQWIHDVFGNCVALLRFEEKAETLRFETRMQVEHASSGIPEFRIRDKVLHYPFQYDGEELPDLSPTITRAFGQPGDEVERWARRFLSGKQETATGKLLMTMCYAIRESFRYSRRTEPGIQRPAETLALGRGTCRDFALLMMEAVRSLGLAARFVSGYIYVPSRDGSDTRGGGATHAWAQVYLPGAGWVEFDPTNGIVGNRDLIRVAVARDPAQAIPLSGSYYGAAEDDLGISIQVNVTTDQNSEGGTEKPPVQGNEAPREGFTERSRDREPARSTHPPSPLREASRT